MPIYLLHCVLAIHFVVVPDLTAQSFIQCFKRFTTRKGFSTKMILTMGLPSRQPPKYCKILSNIPKLRSVYLESNGFSTLRELCCGMNIGEDGKIGKMMFA